VGSRGARLYQYKLRICKAVLVCRLVDPSGNLEPTKENSLFYDPDCKNYVWLMRRKELAPGYLMDDTLTMQCAITVLKELPEPAITAEDVGTPAPSYTLNQHLGWLLDSGTGADVTLLVSGESFAAHKNIY
jgi:speckle-type POZ protein